MAGELTSLSNVDTTTLKLSGTAISATAAEINSVVDGCTATAAEINRVADKSASVVNVTSATLTVTAATHGSRTITLDRAAGITVTLPAATGTGELYRFINKTTLSGGSHIVQVANVTDVMNGGTFVMQDNDVDGTLSMWKADTGDDTITLNGTTTGGFVGTWIECVDYASGFWAVRADGIGSGTLATPFSAAV